MGKLKGPLSKQKAEPAKLVRTAIEKQSVQSTRPPINERPPKERLSQRADDTKRRVSYRTHFFNPLTSTQKKQSESTAAIEEVSRITVECPSTEMWVIHMK